MPVALVVRKSAFLGRGGWFSLSHFRGDAQVLGIDRHGRPSFDQVSIKERPVRTKSVFLASRDTFGVFSDRSRIITADGDPRDLADLCSLERISDVRFETHSLFPPDVRVCDELFWSALSDAVVRVSPNSMLAPFYPSHPGIGGEWGDCFAYGGRKFCAIDRKPVSQSIQRDWAGTILAIANAFFGSDEGVLSFESRHHLVALFALSALRALDQPHAGRYDTLMHTASIELQPSNRWPDQPSTGACCFFPPGEDFEFTTTWSTPGWNPISSGFMLAPSKDPL
jgi:hypothetical protein